jgi:outer membrane receptor for ferrienterochelin and colicin
VSFSKSFPFFISLLVAGKIFAQPESPVLKSSIEEILQLTPVAKEESASVVTQIETPMRETAGIISIITHEEIVQSGARDLMELLTQLPGFNFAHDVSNVLGISTRGLWGHEGKVMVLVDGHVMNETSYGVFQFAQHIVLDNIQRIEISRGPGGAIYGGVAGLAVINIILKNGDQLAGGTFSQTIGHSNDALSRQITTASFGKAYNSGLLLSVHTVFNRTNQSNSFIKLDSGTQINYADSSLANTTMLGLKLSYKGLNVNFLYDDHTVKFTEKTGKSVFEGYYFNSDYTYKINERLTIVPMLSFKQQQPWNFKGVPEGDETNTINTRITGTLRTFYKVNENINILSGIEIYHDRANLLNDSIRFASSSYINSMSNVALFAQSIFKTKWANITTGFRWDHHSIFESAFVPRLALTRVFKKWHQKLVVNYAFKAPAFVNLNVNRDIKPERINSFDIEIGYTAPAGFSATANAFYTQIHKPIIAFSPDGISDTYRSGQTIGSTGFEISAAFKKKWGTLKTNYFFYQALPSDEIFFTSNNDRFSFLGTPTYKWVIQAYFNIGKGIGVTATSIFCGSANALGKKNEAIHIEPTLHSNVIISHQNFLLRQMRFSVGVYNVFDDAVNHPQAFRGEAAPIPSMRREIVLKLAYTFKESR